MNVARPLQTLLLGFEPPSPFLDNLRQRYPEIDFPVASTTGFRHQLSSADALFSWNLTAADLESAGRLRWVQWIGAGVEDAPLEALKARDILFTNNRGVHAVNIAEHVLSLMLSFSRALPFLRATQSRHVWADDDGRKLVRELNGSSLLIAGSGNIGAALAERAEHLGQHVTLVGRVARSSPDGNRHIHSIDELDVLLPQADHVAICLPLTSETEGLFDSRRLALMKPGAFLYNIGRGKIVVTDDLITALQDGHLGGAGLDVIEPEPPPKDHPLWDMPNVILTAHTAGATPNYWARALEILSDNIERYLSGDGLRNMVRFDLGY